MRRFTITYMARENFTDEADTVQHIEGVLFTNGQLGWSHVEHPGRGGFGGGPYTPLDEHELAFGHIPHDLWFQRFYEFTWVDFA